MEGPRQWHSDGSMIDGSNPARIGARPESAVHDPDNAERSTRLRLDRP
jgi:hypothetical protein